MQCIFKSNFIKIIKLFLIYLQIYIWITTACLSKVMLANKRNISFMTDIMRQTVRPNVTSKFELICIHKTQYIQGVTI